MKFRKNLGLIGSGLFLLYALTCIPNSIDLNKKLAPLKEKFIEHALTKDFKVIPKRGYNSISYGGKLEEIIIKRNRILNRDYGFTLPWLVSGDYSTGPFTPSVNPISKLPVLCYNPFHTIE